MIKNIAWCHKRVLKILVVDTYGCKDTSYRHRMAGSCPYEQSGKGWVTEAPGWLLCWWPLPWQSWRRLGGWMYRQPRDRASNVYVSLSCGAVRCGGSAECWAICGCTTARVVELPISVCHCSCGWGVGVAKNAEPFFLTAGIGPYGKVGCRPRWLNSFLTVETRLHSKVNWLTAKLRVSLSQLAGFISPTTTIL